MMCGVKRLVVVMSSMGWIHVTAFPLIKPGNTITLLNFSPLLFSGESVFYIFDIYSTCYLCYTYVTYYDMYIIHRHIIHNINMLKYIKK